MQVCGVLAFNGTAFFFFGCETNVLLNDEIMWKVEYSCQRTYYIGLIFPRSV